MSRSFKSKKRRLRVPTAVRRALNRVWRAKRRAATRLGKEEPPRPRNATWEYW